MNIIFKQLRATNFLSLGSVQLSLLEQGFVAIEGINQYELDNATSNGVGKSSIAEAIVFALVGDTIRGTKDVVRKGSQGNCSVELDFVFDDKEYTIIRYKDHKEFDNQIKIFKNGIDVSGKGIRDTESIIKQEFPDLSRELIGGVIILGQGMPQRFTSNSPVERKAVLEKLSKSDFMIEDIKTRLTNRKTKLQQVVRDLEDSLLGNERECRLKSVDLVEVDSTLAGLNQLDVLTSKQLELKSLCKDIKDNCISSRAVVDQLDLELLKLNEDILNLSEFLAVSKEKETGELKEFLKPLWAKKSTNELRIEQLKKEISKAKNIKDTCPTCGQKLQGIICIDTVGMEEELKNLQTLAQSIITQTTQTEEGIKAIELAYLNKQDLKILKDRQKLTQLDKVEKERKCRELETSLSFKQMELNKVEVELNSYEQSIKDLADRKLKLQNSIISLQDSIKTDKISKDDKAIRLDIIQKLLTTAQREFRTYLLESVIVYIDRRVKYYSEKLFNSEADFKQDGNAIWIGFLEKQYENLSGGEKQKIDICVQFSIRDMLVDILGFNSNVLFLDEIMDNLDLKGTDSLINLIMSELGSVGSVYIISHHSDTMIPYDKRIQLIKNSLGVTNLIGE